MWACGLEGTKSWITGYEAYLGIGKSQTCGNWGNFIRARYGDFCALCSAGCPAPG